MKIEHLPAQNSVVLFSFLQRNLFFSNLVPKMFVPIWKIISIFNVLLNHSPWNFKEHFVKYEGCFCAFFWVNEEHGLFGDFHWNISTTGMLFKERVLEKRSNLALHFLFSHIYYLNGIPGFWEFTFSPKFSKNLSHVDMII